MTRRVGPVHVARIVRKYKDTEYVSHLLRRSYRQDGKVRHETLGNISALPAEAIEVLRAALAGKTLVVAGEGFEIVRSIPHGHVAAVAAQAETLGLAEFLGPPCRQRDLAIALVVARVCRPASKLATTRWWQTTTLAGDLGVADATTDDVYGAMDWLAERQAAIEQRLARRHLADGALVLYDLSSSWVEGSHCALAARGYSRDGKTGRAQIEYGLMTDAAGRPIAVEVFAGNTADPTAFISAVDAVRDRFGLSSVVMVGDRGMITSARIEAIRALGGLGWITSLRAPAIRALAEGGVLQLSLFDETNLAEITDHPDYPGERLVACRNPALATARSHKRDELLAATEALLEPIAASVTAGRLAGADKIGVRVGKVINRHKMAKHFSLDITDTAFGYTRNDADDRGRGRPRRDLHRAYLPRRRPPRRRRCRRRLQRIESRRGRLPQPQDDRLGPPPDPPLDRPTRPRPRVHLHARRLPRLAPPPSMGPDLLHRRRPPNTHRPRRPRPTFHPSHHQRPRANAPTTTTPPTASPPSSTTSPPSPVGPRHVDRIGWRVGHAPQGELADRGLVVIPGADDGCERI